MPRFERRLQMLPGHLTCFDPHPISINIQIIQCSIISSYWWSNIHHPASISVLSIIQYPSLVMKEAASFSKSYALSSILRAHVGYLRSYLPSHRSTPGSENIALVSVQFDFFFWRNYPLAQGDDSNGAYHSFPRPHDYGDANDLLWYCDRCGVLNPQTPRKKSCLIQFNTRLPDVLLIFPT